MSDPLPGAQAHIEAALKLAAKIDDLPADTPLLPIAKVGVIGAGTMGGGITMNFLSAGIPVTIVEQEQAALDRGVAVMGKQLRSQRQARPDRSRRCCRRNGAPHPQPQL
jgi:3-hydroxyacyl-CoA dehydrogenase